VSSPRAAVIQFPGVNCEYEAARALGEVGLEAVVVRWNEGKDLLGRYAGFVLPGGFSYQDRVRGGVIASRDPVVDRLRQAADGGAPILGICNGAQILVEAALVPGWAGDRVETALAPNRIPGRTGYHCAWVEVRHTGALSFLQRTLEEGEVLPLPVAHGEGRFHSEERGFFAELLEAGQIPLQYADRSGAASESFPYCPNGSLLGAAALCNREGNVVAMMPHPERAAWLHQVPDQIPSRWASEKLRMSKGDPSGAGLFAAGPGRKILAAFAAAVKERCS